MTARFVAMCMAWSACATTPVCEGEACEAVCEAYEDAQRQAVPEGGTLLSHYEATLLHDELQQVRMGIPLSGPEGFGICEGATACERFLGTRVIEPAPPGDYVAIAVVDVPEVGRWTLEVTSRCLGPSGPFGESTQRIPVSAGTGKQVALARFRHPGGIDADVTCTVIADFPARLEPIRRQASIVLRAR